MTDASTTLNDVRATVVVVTFNSAAHIQRALDALAAQTFTDFDVVVFDNASADGGVDDLTTADNVRIVRSPENLGFAAGNNRAAALSRAPYIVALNPDAFPEPAWLERLVARAEAHPGAASVGSLQLSDADPGRLDGAGDVYHVSGIPYRGGFGARVPADLAAGGIFGPCAAAALYRRDAFEAAGGFDESYFCYCEDVDLAFRLRLSGWTSVLEPAAVVRHVGSATMGRRSRFAVVHGVRNRTWTIWKCAPAALLWLMLPLHALAVAAILVQGLARGHGVARWTLAGLRDGFAGLGGLSAERRRVQRARTAPLIDIARAMTWSPWKLATRGHDVRPFSTDQPPPASMSRMSGSDT